MRFTVGRPSGLNTVGIQIAIQLYENVEQTLCSFLHVDTILIVQHILGNCLEVAGNHVLVYSGSGDILSIEAGSSLIEAILGSAGVVYTELQYFFRLCDCAQLHGRFFVLAVHQRESGTFEVYVCGVDGQVNLSGITSGIINNGALRQNVVAFYALSQHFSVLLGQCILLIYIISGTDGGELNLNIAFAVVTHQDVRFHTPRECE